MKKLLLAIAVFALLLLSSCQEHYYYKNVDTGIVATVDSSKNNVYGIDNLIINGKNYSLVKDDSLNILHADNDVEILAPFANFGENGSYTLYEIKTELPFKVYIDNKNRAIFCMEENVEKCKQYFNSAYDNENSVYFEIGS